MSYSSSDFYSNIAMGRYSSITPWSKIGFNSGVVVAERDLAPWLGAASTPANQYLFPTAELTMTIVSSSAKDCQRAITAFANSANHAGVNTLVTCAGNGLADGDSVIIEGTTNYNGTYIIEHKVADAFEIIKVYTSNDATGTVRGPGANTVTVYYLDDGFIEKSATVTLLGATPVTIATDIYRINNARITTAGTSFVPIGNLTIANGGNTYGYISLGRTRQRQLVYTVPILKTLYITQVAFASGKQAASQYVRFATKANYDDKSGLVLPRGLFMPFQEEIMANDNNIRQLYPPVKFPATTDLKVSVSSSSTDTADCTASMRGFLVTV